MLNSEEKELCKSRSTFHLAIRAYRLRTNCSLDKAIDACRKARLEYTDKIGKDK